MQNSFGEAWVLSDAARAKAAAVPAAVSSLGAQPKGVQGARVVRNYQQREEEAYQAPVPGPSGVAPKPKYHLLPAGTSLSKFKANARNPVNLQRAKEQSARDLAANVPKPPAAVPKPPVVEPKPPAAVPKPSSVVPKPSANKIPKPSAATAPRTLGVSIRPSHSPAGPRVVAQEPAVLKRPARKSTPPRKCPPVRAPPPSPVLPDNWVPAYPVPPPLPVTPAGPSASAPALPAPAPFPVPRPAPPLPALRLRSAKRSRSPSAKASAERPAGFRYRLVGEWNKQEEQEEQEKQEKSSPTRTPVPSRSRSPERSPQPRRRRVKVRKHRHHSGRSASSKRRHSFRSRKVQHKEKRSRAVLLPSAVSSCPAVLRSVSRSPPHASRFEGYLHLQPPPASPCSSASEQPFKQRILADVRSASPSEEKADFSRAPSASQSRGPSVAPAEGTVIASVKPEAKEEGSDCGSDSIRNVCNGRIAVDIHNVFDDGREDGTYPTYHRRAWKEAVEKGFTPWLLTFVGKDSSERRAACERIRLDLAQALGLDLENPSGPSKSAVFLSFADSPTGIEGKAAVARTYQTRIIIDDRADILRDCERAGVLGVQVVFRRGLKKFTSSVLSYNYRASNFRFSLDLLFERCNPLLDDIQEVWERRVWNPEAPDCTRAASSAAASSAARQPRHRHRRGR